MQLLKATIRPFIEPYKLRALVRDKYYIFVLQLFPYLPERFRRQFLHGIIRQFNQYDDNYYVKVGEFPASDIDNITPDNRTFLVSAGNDRRFEWLEIATANKQYKDVRLVFLPYIWFHTLFEHYMGDFAIKMWVLDREKIAENQTVYDRQLRAYERVILSIFETLKILYNPDALLTSSSADARWFLAAPVAQKLGLPWLVTEREGIISYGSLTRGSPIVREYLHRDVDLMTTVNSTHRKRWTIAGQSPNKLIITGDLKSDYWRYPNRWSELQAISPKLRPDRIRILYFTFGLRNYIEEYMFPEISENWKDLKRDHFEVLLQIANEFPDRVQLILKYGHVFDAGGEMDFSLPNVVKLNRSYQAQDLMVTSDIIIGFQTTALIESMFTDKPILYPAWGDTFDKYHDPYLLPFHTTNAVTHLKSRSDFYNTLKDLVMDDATEVSISNEIKAERKRFREEYYHLDPDESVGERVLSVFGNYLNQLDDVPK